jgi:hypothetical protein
MDRNIPFPNVNSSPNLSDTWKETDDGQFTYLVYVLKICATLLADSEKHKQIKISLT